MTTTSPIHTLALAACILAAALAFRDREPPAASWGPPTSRVLIPAPVIDETPWASVAGVEVVEAIRDAEAQCYRLERVKAVSTSPDLLRACTYIEPRPSTTEQTCMGLEKTRGRKLYRNWRPVCREIAARAPSYGVRPALAVAVAWHESRLDPHAIGALGEVGPLQVRPELHCDGRCADPIGAGLAVLARYIDEHGEARGMCRYRGAALGCNSPRVALANAIEGR